MIVFDLLCQQGSHRFEGWFGSSDDFADQQARGLVTCPFCESADVIRAVSAPNLGRKSNQMTVTQGPVTATASAPAPAPTPTPTQLANAPLPPEALAMLKTIAKLQAEALKSSTWVGDRFADKARAIHYGEQDAIPIHGQATPEEASALIEEGVEIAPILFPVSPPGKAN